ncbi:MAG: pentapeptide repeat-containing protein, partial [Chloroflexota bacterium]
AADFRGTVLTKSRFNNTNLSEANFEGASEYTIDILLALCHENRPQTGLHQRTQHRLLCSFRF